MSNEVYGWGFDGESKATNRRIRLAVRHEGKTAGMCLDVGDYTEIVLDDATAIALAGMLTGGDLADDLYRTAKALQARNGSASTSAFLRQVADEIDERPRWTEAMR